ncbi:hypothetical protein HDU76_008737, partial [Blyttiomyces sp. JEL0837]
MADDGNHHEPGALIDKKSSPAKARADDKLIKDLPSVTRLNKFGLNSGLLDEIHRLLDIFKKTIPGDRLFFKSFITLNVADALELVNVCTEKVLEFDGLAYGSDDKWPLSTHSVLDLLPVARKIGEGSIMAKNVTAEWLTTTQITEAKRRKDEGASTREAAAAATVVVKREDYSGLTAEERDAKRAKLEQKLEDLQESKDAVLEKYLAHLVSKKKPLTKSQKALLAKYQPTNN